MTKREAEIYKWICENPLISQEEIAQRAGITRSSVAVHISNLMKKGYIKGKGYITDEKGYILVIGAVNVDIGGIPDREIIPEDSNPGKVTFALGGVGRNIAHNMRLLDLNVKLLSAIGQDENGEKIISSCKDLGIDISSCLRTWESATSTYLFINNKEGNMIAAVSDMEIYEKITPKYIETKKEIIEKADMIVLDTNLTKEAILEVAKYAKCPIIADPVSCQKAVKLTPILKQLDTITPNHMEASILSGTIIRPKDEKTLSLAARRLIEKGVKRVFITLGKDGVYYSDGNTEGFQKAYDCRLVNATGAGDAFVAGIALAYTKNLNTEKMCKVGQGAACISAEGNKTINEKLNENLLNKKCGGIL